MGEKMSLRELVSKPLDLRITCAPGLEEVLLEELERLGVHRGEIVRTSCVRLQCEIEALLHVLENTRVASKILLPLREFAAKNSEMLYDQVRRIRWNEIFSPDLSLRIECHGLFPETIKASFAPLKIKDAICDEFRKHCNDQRPNIDTQNPDIRVEAYFAQGRCELSIDLCGIPLHRRGYREDGGEAPLREDRAAALLDFCGYRGQYTLVDPFCGSGTIPIEAAIYLKSLPFRRSGLLRDLTIFRLLPELLDTRSKTQAHLSPISFRPIFASDIDFGAIHRAKENIRLADVTDWIKIRQEDALQLKLDDPENSLIVANPPYGERISEKAEAAELLKAFVSHVKQNLAPTRLGLVVSEDLKNAIGLRPQKQLSLKSGDLKLKMLFFEIRKGSFKKN
jgi:23S rRNA G2445 N2-methylase RlmL